MKFLKKRLPALLLALIIAVMPLFLAVPAQASVLDGPSPAPVVDGYSCVFSIEDNGDIGFVYIPDGRFHPDLPSFYFFDFENSMFYVVSGLALSVEYPYISASVFGRSVYVSSSCTFDEENLTFVFSSFEEADSESLLSWPLDFSIFTSGFIGCSSSVAVVNAFPDSFFVVPLYGEPGPGIFSVFSGISSWFAGAIGSATSMFWTVEGGLTVLGVLAVASLAIAAIILLIYLLAGWLKFK